MELGKYSLNLVIWMEILIKINGNHTDFLIFQIQDFLIINCGCIKIIQQNFIFIELTICKKKKCSDSDCFSSTHYQIDGEIFIYSD